MNKIINCSMWNTKIKVMEAATKHYKVVYRFAKANCNNSIIFACASQEDAHKQFNELFQPFKNKIELKSIELYTEPIYTYY